MPLKMPYAFALMFARSFNQKRVSVVPKNSALVHIMAPGSSLELTML